MGKEAFKTEKELDDHLVSSQVPVLVEAIANLSKSFDSATMASNLRLEAMQNELKEFKDGVKEELRGLKETTKTIADVHVLLAELSVQTKSQKEHNDKTFDRAFVSIEDNARRIASIERTMNETCDTTTQSVRKEISEKFSEAKSESKKEIDTAAKSLKTTVFVGWTLFVLFFGIISVLIGVIFYGMVDDIKESRDEIKAIRQEISGMKEKISIKATK